LKATRNWWESVKNWTELQYRNRRYERAFNFMLRRCHKPKNIHV